MYEGLLFSLYRNLSTTSFLLSSRGGSFASTCRDFTDKVLKAPGEVQLLWTNSYFSFK